MTGAAIGLVVLSAFAHASWNFLTKRAIAPEVFTWCMALASNVIMAPLAVFLLVSSPPSATGWGFIFATWVLHIAYFVFLSRAYAKTDLSIAYPVARGLGLMLIPMLGLLWLDESVTLLAWVGISFIVLGIFTLTWWGRFKEITANPGRLLNDIGFRYAVATGIVIAVYSAVDKRGVSHVTPFLYMYFVSAAGSLGMFPFVWRAFKRADLAREWRSHRVSIVAGGLLQYAAYGLVLSAFEIARVSYVGPFREIGIVVGVLLGAIVLRERFGRGRVLGAVIVALGAALVALAP